MNDTTKIAGLRILVAEDEAVIAMALADTLRRFGCDVVGPMPSVGKGLEAAMASHLDGALLDINLRGEVVYPLADMLLARGVPIVFVTGYGETGIDRRFIGTPVVTKPFAAVTLERLITQYMARAASPAGSAAEN